MTDSANEPRRALRTACIALLGLVLAGLVAARMVAKPPFPGMSLFYEQFARIEPASLLLLAVFLIVVLLLRRGEVDATSDDFMNASPRALALLCVCVAIVAAAGEHWVFHGF